MLTKKQRAFFNLIIKCYKENKTFPTLTILKEQGNFKSYNSVYKYLNILEEKGYIKKDKYSTKVTYILSNIDNKNIITIPIINDNSFCKIPKEDCSKDIEYLAYLVHDSKLKSESIERNDLLIIEKYPKKLNNKLVLILKDNKYYIYKYSKHKDFISLYNDKENITLESNIKIIGRVTTLIRKFSLIS